MKLLRRNTGFVGVDIGSQSIKVAQLVRRGGQLLLERAYVMECDQPLSWDEAASNSAKQIAGLKSVLKACDRLRGRTAAATLSMKFCEHQAEPIPGDLDETQVAKAAGELAARQTQLTGRSEHDHWVSSTHNAARGTTNSTLHVLATPTAVAETIARDHHRGGYICQTLDGLPLALARALRLGGYTGSQPVAAIDWGFAQATLCVVAGGQPAFVRTFRIGEYGLLLDQLSTALKLPSSEARRVLASPGLPPPAGAEIADAAGAKSNLPELQKKIVDSVSAALAGFRDELERSLAYLRARHSELAPTEIVLLGGGATVAGIDAQIASWTGIRARVWDFPQTVIDDGPAMPVCLLGPAIAMSGLAWDF